MFIKILIKIEGMYTVFFTTFTTINNHNLFNVVIQLNFYDKYVKWVERLLQEFLELFEKKSASFCAFQIIFNFYQFLDRKIFNTELKFSRFTIKIFLRIFHWVTEYFLNVSLFLFSTKEFLPKNHFKFFF